MDQVGRPQVVLKVRHLSTCYDHISVSFERNGDFHLTCQDKCKASDDDDQHIIVHRPEQGIWEGADVTDDGNTSTFTVFGNTSRTMPLNMLLAPPAAAIVHQPDALASRGYPLLHLLYLFVLLIPCSVRFLAN